VDFSKLHELDPTTDIVGGLFDVAYDLNPEDASATVGFTGFGELIADASYAYTTTAAGDGTMGLLVQHDIDPFVGSGLLEDHSIFSRWASDGSGRGDARVSGGDLGETEAHASECWSTSFERVFYTEDWSGVTEGEVGACSFGDTQYF
jgi:hypothetical protein